MFERILKEVILPNEGGYVNNPNDRGGATNYGITQATYDKYLSNKYPDNSRRGMGVKYITQNEVVAIYRSFWIKSRCDLLLEYAPALTVQHFDFVVNAGYERKGIDAAETLQRVINSYIPTTVDGYVGPKTLGNIISYIRSHPLGGDKELNMSYSHRRAIYYNDIVANNPSQYVFLNGWKKRIGKVNTWIVDNIQNPNRVHPTR